ncbi:MAG TPA: type I DNA topoisomerase [Bryobacteraceae bacterium]|nr:type I DNA topoisomerase [Bryobacteraceae bacterium]
MAKALVIVESPAKAKTINKYLGKQFIVKASLGHIKDLPKRDLAVDVEHGFEPRYEVIEGKRKLISELKQAAKSVQQVYLAADPDREGEAICYHLQEELQNGKKGGPEIFRVMFNEITKGAIQKAFEKPVQVNLHLVDAQQARRVLDRLVGYKISPLLWDKVRRGLSAGRVQTVALRLIVEREREIRAFVPREYWTLDADLAAKKPPLLSARLFKIGDQPAEIASQEASDAVVAALEGVDYTVRSVGTREKKRNPVAPFITSTLQQEASRKLRFSVKRTMMLAQRLYEGVEIGKEAVGLITYMRTDSTRISEDAVRDARHYIGERYGKDFLPDAPNVYRSKKDAQDAHEAIRPTSMAYTPEMVETHLAEDEMKLYRLIWNRFVASQMMPALYDQTTIDVAAKGQNGTDYFFRATGSVRKFEGFLKIYEEGKDQTDEEDEELKHRLPLVTEGETLRLKTLKPEQHFTEPPPRYNEATLVKRLEADGVGRPSTYASILSTIQEREYVQKEGGRFIPTELGMVVTDLLLESFDDIFEVKYTARMEEELDDIEEGKIDWRAAMSEFYERFDKDLKHAEEHMTDIKRMEKPTDLICEKCGRPLVVKWGKHGSFLACTGYPDFSPRNADADIEALQKDIAKRQERLRKDSDERSAKMKARHETDLAKLEMQGDAGRKHSARRRTVQIRYQHDIEDLLKHMKEKKRADREAIALRLEKLKARYPQIEQFYDHLELRDAPEGMVFAPLKNQNLCTYTRELTVDLPDVDKVDLSEQGDEEYCENCGRPMVLKKGRFGTFYACTGFPDCKTTKPIGGPQKKPDQPLEEKCPQCGNHLVLKTGRFGEFTACSNYPTCKYVKHKTIGVLCPECSTGEIVERRSKRGRTFYGCNRWPECNFVAWGKPIPEKCPECGSPYMVEKWLKAGPVWQCPNADCKHKQPAPQPEPETVTQ